MQKISFYIPSVHSSDAVNFWVPSSDWPHPFLTMFTPKIFNHLLICVKLYQHAKNQLVPSVLSWDTINFRFQRPDWPHSFLTMPHQKLFNRLFVNLYQYAKNEAVLSICWINTLKSCNLNGWGYFGLYLRNNIFLKQKICRGTANNINFHYRANSGKATDQISL